MCQSNDDQGDLDRRIQEVFERASRFLEETSGGSARQDLDLATNNLTKMYELDAPEFLIRKAHYVQRQRLRSFRVWTRTNLAFSRMPSPTERRREFILIQGAKV
jgi:hypothetical protein